MRNYTARQIAEWFLAWADEAEDAGVSNLKLQKLLYYAQGHHLGDTGAPLFRDEFQAWSHGPVIPSLYRDFKAYGSASIDADDEVRDDFDWDSYRDIETHLMKIWNTYGQFDAWRLRNMTHRESPWLDTFDDGQRNVLIPKESMRSFFAQV